MFYTLLVITCPPTQPILHGSRNDTEALFGSAILYTCDAGYWFPDKSFTKSTTCMNDRTWSAVVEDCIGKEMVLMEPRHGGQPQGEGCRILREEM